MNRPFTLILDVEEVNTDARPEPSPPKYKINLTLAHRIEDIKESIWLKSKDYCLNPLLLTLNYKGATVANSSRIGDVIGVSELSEDSYHGGFVLIVDYLMLNSPSVPKRQPVVAIFDVYIQWKDNDKESKMHIRETLDCTVGVLKDYLIEKRSKSLSSETEITRYSFVLTLEKTGINCESDEESISSLLRLDVAPLKPVIFNAVFTRPSIAASPVGRSKRFHVHIESDQPSLQEGANLFEVNARTKLIEFKQQLIDKIDYMSVKRTFYDQIKLAYNDYFIETTEEANDMKLYNLLGLDESILEANRNVIKMKLTITNDLSGIEGGIFSRQFFRDLRSPNRFEFLPHVSNDPSSRHAQSSDTTPSATTQYSAQPSQPTKISLDGNKEYISVGESYDLMKLESSSASEGGNKSAILVNQNDTSPVIYEFSMEIEGETKTVQLNTSQCIVFDKGTSQQYVALSPSGSSKLSQIFSSSDGRSLIHYPTVNIIEQHINESSNESSPPSASHSNTTTHNNSSNVDVPQQGEEHGQDFAMRDNQREGQPNENVGRTIFTWCANWVQRRLGTVIRFGVFIYFYRLNGLFFNFWKPLLLLIVISWVSFVVFLRGGRVADFIETTLIPDHPNNGRQQQRGLYASSLRSLAAAMRFVEHKVVDSAALIKRELISYAVDRKSDFSYIVAESKTVTVVVDTIECLFKDSILAVLALSPFVYAEISEALDARKMKELNELATQVTLQDELYRTLLDDYRKTTSHPLVHANQSLIEELRSRVHAHRQHSQLNLPSTSEAMDSTEIPLPRDTPPVGPLPASTNDPDSEEAFEAYYRDLLDLLLLLKPTSIEVSKAIMEASARAHNQPQRVHQDFPASPASSANSPASHSPDPASSPATHAAPPASIEPVTRASAASGMSRFPSLV